jgi:phospholipid/cholesterol/gamma-HCH transport system substrate-binding protein
MAEKISEVLTGAGVLAVALGFAAYAGFGGSLTPPGDSYDLRASFRSAQGINVGTDVRMAGVKIGSVLRLDLNPQTYYADTTFTVKNAVEVPDDSTVVVASEGLLGGNFIEIQPGGSPDSLTPGGEIEDTQSAVGLVELLMKFVGQASSGSDAASKPAP